MFYIPAGSFALFTSAIDLPVACLLFPLHVGLDLTPERAVQGRSILAIYLDCNFDTYMSYLSHRRVVFMYWQ